MAEFKLGRIRFVWKGAWVSSTVYYKDDIIRHGGRTYICISGHTASASFTTDEATKWQKFTDGTEWQSTWTSGTAYKVNDIVKYGGYLYVCNTSHTSETPGGKLETDQAKWDLFAEGFDWKNDWLVATHYKVNDIVKYGGTLYLCTVAHTSSGSFNSDEDGLEADAAKWDTFAQGQDWKTDWAPNTRYKKHDEVKYGGQLYIANQGHISGADAAEGLEVDQTKWDYLHKGIEYKSVHSATTRYKANDVVKYGGGLWICQVGHTSTTNLAADVTANGVAATVDTISGADVARTAGTYNDVTGTSSGSGIMTHTRFNVVVDSNGACTVTLVSGGYGHTATDVISIPNTQIGGSGATLTFNVATITTATRWLEFVAGLEFEDSWSNATNYQPGDFVTYGGYSYISKTNNSNVVPFGNTAHWDLFTTGFNLQGDYDNATAYKTGDVVRVGGYTYLCKANSTGNRPPNATYWDRLNSGISWKDSWTNGTFYDAGDAVRGIGNNNSYICKLAHTADQVSAQNRPDQDVAGTYWNLLSGGVESGNLTTAGDIVYYGGAGPTRLGIGTAGQVLKVNAAGDAPEWAYFGQVEGVYYVGPNGADGVAPIDGVTLDKPWKSVRYALNEIRKGPRNVNACTLLKRNKAFISEEAGIQYVAWKIANNSAPFSTGYTHDSAKCKRDMNIIIDALIYDVSHGGNRRSREAALSFFTDAGASYISGQTTQTVDVINYMVSIIDTTIRNLAPAINYQNLNGVGSPILRKTETNSAEEGVYTTIQTLAAIITDAITAGNTTGVPKEQIGYNTLFVKTGIYKETLPMIVPEGTAVVGDELRSTEIKALTSGDSITSNAHATLTMQGLAHIKSIIDNVILNTSITKTPAGAHLTMNNLGAADGSRTAGTYTGVTGTSSGAGTVGTFNIVVDGSGACTVTVATGGSGHTVGHTITIADANLGGGGAAAFTMDVATIAAGNTKTQDTALPAGSAAAGTQAQALLQDSSDKINFEVFGSGTAPLVTGKSGRDSTQGYVDARLRILENLDFIAEEVVEYLKTTHTSTYDFTKDAKCKSDMKEFCYAVMYDLEHYGNYKSVLYGTWLSNATNGCQKENMFLVQNGTGVRNMTVNGLSGSLGSANSYGTKRPDTGAYISLDPGWGTNDKATWITTKSPYIQNVTTIGEKCIGAKVDGDLHAGGNDSIVANDFTQIINDGIAIWVTNLGRVELVSVFTYYGHIGYLAEAGGKIRATNGNNSYGDFGSVSEGVDLTEEYVNAYVDNRSYQAIIGNIIVDNAKIIALEYTNAGRDYVPGQTTYTFSGDGYGIAGVTPVVVTGGVMQVRMTGTSGTFGGADYVTAGNTIQAGNATQVTISNTDVAISSAYVGMAIVLTSGKGAGQVGYIDTYNAATKIATVKKPSDDTAGWDHMISGTAIETLLDNTTTYSIEPRVVFSAPTGDGSTATSTAKGRAKVVDGKITEVRIYDPGTSYTSAPTCTFTDPNNTADAPLEVYIGDGVLTQPTFTDAGSAWTTASATVVDVGTTKNITGVTYTANPFAETLLVANKEYVKDEVVAWIDNQIAGGGNPTLWDGFVHDKVKCERDIGYLIDAFVHDLKYGSNRETVKAAKKYWIGTQFVGGEAPQIVAAYEQMRTILLDFVLDNTAYSSLQSVTTQTTNANDGEAVAQTRLGELISIITQVVTHGLSVVPGHGSDGILDITVTGHNIPGKTKVAISGVTGTNQLNANSFYVGVVDVNTLRLYIDENLLHPAVGTNYSAYISGGIITYGGGYRDQKQDGKYLQVESMLSIPQPGSNVEFASVPNTWFKLVSVTNLTGSNPYSALLQLSPNVEIPDSPAHGEVLTIRIRYSQVRLTGHDFLDVGTGDFTSTNYPGTPATPSDQADETKEFGGGRVFMTSTDQDGNFRVGDLFTVEQATGIATLNADAFSISGLQELQLGSVAVGSTGATINEFSTDGTFTANSDSIVPTQKAIKTFITSQIGGGASELNVNSVTAGIVNIQGNTITTTTGARINTTATMHFSAGVSGAPVAMQQFLLS